MTALFSVLLAGSLAERPILQTGDELRERGVGSHAAGLIGSS